MRDRCTHSKTSNIITFQRHKLNLEDAQWIHNMVNLGNVLLPLGLLQSQGIESFQNATKAMFANKHIGGGVLKIGCV